MLSGLRDVAQPATVRRVAALHRGSAGWGPPFVKIGRHVRYLVADVEAWLAAKRQTNTAQNGTQPQPARCPTCGHLR